MKILIAGGTGLIGNALMPVLSATHTVHALARAARSSSDNVHWHIADLCGPSRAWQLPDKWDVAIYLAQSSGYREFPEKAADMMAVNVDAPIALLDASRKCGATKFVLASTANVYAASHTALDERAATNPTSFYARTRLAAEMLAEPFSNHLDVTIARIFTTYGPSQRADSLIASLIDRVRAGRAVQVQGERGLLLSPLYVSDAATAIAAVVDRPSRQGFTIVNVAGAQAVNIEALARTIGAVVGREPVIERTSGAEPGGWIGDIAALRALVGWSPVVDLEHGLRQTIAGGMS